VVNQPHVADSLDRLFAENGLAVPQSTTRTNSLSLIKALVARHGFVSTLPDHLIAEEVRRGDMAILKLPQGRIERRAGLIYRRGSDAQAALAIALTHIRQVCARATPR
jgi:DNA-binding transcriptional LysR family regulator